MQVIIERIGNDAGIRPYARLLVAVSPAGSDEYVPLQGRWQLDLAKRGSCPFGDNIHGLIRKVTYLCQDL
jgi:hypothetical protein